MVKVLVTGAGGQLGQSIKRYCHLLNDLEFYYKDSSELDLTNQIQVKACLEMISPDYVINTAAYTAVDLAESHKDQVFKVNVEAVEYLVEAIKGTNTKLIHLSTDFVFNGKSDRPYRETDTPEPINYYGFSKYLAEQVIEKELKTNYFIIRTSWVYSEFGTNFFKTILRLASNKESIAVVEDQIGNPTHTSVIVDALIWVIRSQTDKYGIYHVTGVDTCSWYDFAKKIVEQYRLDLNVIPIKSFQYPTQAKRPYYSVLDNEKFEELKKRG